VEFVKQAPHSTRTSKVDESERRGNHRALEALGSFMAGSLETNSPCFKTPAWKTA